MTAETPCYDCEGARLELDAFVRGELPLDMVDRMRQHFDRCGHCAAVAKYEQAFRDRLRRVGGECCPATLRARIVALLGPEARATE